MRRQLRLNCRIAQSALFNQAMVTQDERLPVGTGLDTAPSQGSESLKQTGTLIEAACNRFGHRMIRVTGEVRRPAQNLPLGHLRVNKLGGHHYRLAFSDGAGFVQRNGFDLVGTLQIDTTFDQNASACGSSQAANDRDRRRNHQGTGAGNDEQHQGFVNRLRPGDVHQPGRQSSDGDRQRKDGRRINRRELVNELLRWGAGPLRLFDGVNDARDQGVAGCSADAHFEHAGVVDGACENGVSNRLVDRKTLPRDGCLIDGAGARHNLSIQWNTSPWFDPNDGVQCH